MKEIIIILIIGIIYAIILVSILNFLPFSNNAKFFMVIIISILIFLVLKVIDKNLE